MGKGCLIVWSKTQRLWTVILVAVLFLLGILVLTGETTVLAVSVDSEFVGYVYSQNDLERVIESLAAEITNDSRQEYKIAQEIKFDKVKKFRNHVTPQEQLKQIMAERLSFLGIGYQMSVQGQEIVWVKDKEAAEEVEKEIIRLTREKLERNKKIQIQEIQIQEEIEGKTGFCSINQLKDVSEAVQIFLSGDTRQKKHLVQKGDTFWSIGQQYQLSIEQLREANDGNLSDLLSIGQELKLEVSAPYITIRTTEKTVIQEEIPYPIRVVSDQGLWAGVREVRQKGKTGLKQLTVLIKNENGEKIDQIVLNEKIICLPVEHIISQGTRSLPDRGGGRFIWPLKGEISSLYGFRRGRIHQGIDIAAAQGSPVKAADDGIVTCSEWRNGYGYTVVINHGGSISTLYAHNSQLLVSAGDSVNRGQTIALVGSTGSSTGPHLHFEVQNNGKAVNSLNYFN